MPLVLDNACGKIIQSCPKARLLVFNEYLQLSRNGEGGGYYVVDDINNVQISPVHNKRTKAEQWLIRTSTH